MSACFFLLLGREEGEACWNAGEIPEEILVIVTIALAAEKLPSCKSAKKGASQGYGSILFSTGGLYAKYALRK